MKGKILASVGVLAVVAPVYMQLMHPYQMEPAWAWLRHKANDRTQLCFDYHSGANNVDGYLGDAKINQDFSVSAVIHIKTPSGNFVPLVHDCSIEQMELFAIERAEGPAPKNESFVPFVSYMDPKAEAEMEQAWAELDKEVEAAQAPD